MATGVAASDIAGARRVGALQPDPYLRRDRKPGQREPGSTRVGSPLDFAFRPDGMPRPDLPCRQPDVDPEAFFPVGSAGWQHEAQVAFAKALCAGCPVRLHCRRYALADTSIRFGVWGGVLMDDMTSRTRTLLLAKTRRELERAS